jgi:hypothetical protein
MPSKGAWAVAHYDILLSFWESEMKRFVLAIEPAGGGVPTAAWEDQKFDEFVDFAWFTFVSPETDAGEYTDSDDSDYVPPSEEEAASTEECSESEEEEEEEQSGEEEESESEEN